MASPKEPHIFDDPNFDPDLIDEKYQNFFSNDVKNTIDKSNKLLGEATPIYMFLPEIPEQLYNYNPKLKLIVLLRHPVERAVSHYCMERNRGNESRSFLARLLRDAKNRELDSSMRVHSYLSRGDYSFQLKELLRWFSRDQILLVDFEELNNNHEKCLTKVFEFLDVNPGFRVEAEQVFSTPNKNIPKWIISILNTVFFKRIASYRKLVTAEKVD